MNSFSGRFLRFLLNVFKVKESSFDKIGDENSKPPKGLYKKLKIKEIKIKGRTVYYLAPKKTDSKTRILYLHGGAYTHNFKIVHWLFLEKIINATGSVVIAPDYPLAPDNNYRDSFDLVLPLYKKLCSKVGGRNVILMGDSSGGGFALALAQKGKEQKMDGAGQIILLSPWLDITLNNEEVIKLEPKDPLLSIEKLIEAGKLYAGGDDPKNYMLSPIYGSTDGLGKISVFIGTHDILLADAKKLKEKAEKSGVEINYFEYPDMIHVWMLMGLPESKKATTQIIELIGNNSL